MANALEAPFTTIVRSLISGNWAIDSWLPTKFICSYISSEITYISLWGIITSAIAFNSSFEYKLPVGLQGEEKIIAFVLGVMAFFICWAETLKLFSTVVFITTGFPPASFTNSR